MMRLGHLPTEEELKKMVAEVDQVCKLVDGQMVVIGQKVVIALHMYIEGGHYWAICWVVENSKTVISGPKRDDRVG